MVGSVEITWGSKRTMIRGNRVIGNRNLRRVSAYPSTTSRANA